METVIYKKRKFFQPNNNKKKVSTFIFTTIEQPKKEKFLVIRSNVITKNCFYFVLFVVGLFPIIKKKTLQFELTNTHTHT